MHAADERKYKKIVEWATEATIKQIERSKDEQRKRRLHNTKLLLKHYREFVLHLEGFDPGKETDEFSPFEELDEEELAVESIKRSKERTFIMVQFINRMIEIYRILCEQSGKPEDLRRYHIISDMYIVEHKKTVKEIADCHNVENRTLYRDVNEAVKSLSALLFGVDGIKMMK